MIGRGRKDSDRWVVKEGDYLLSVWRRVDGLWQWRISTESKGSIAGGIDLDDKKAKFAAETCVRESDLVQSRLRELRVLLPFTHNPKRWTREEPLTMVVENDVTTAEVFRRFDDLAVVISLEPQKSPSVRWLHASASFGDHTPSWSDMSEVKETFFGAETMAVQMHAPRSQWVNEHPYTLHLWRNVLGNTVPDEVFP